MYIVAYDISEAKERNKVIKVLNNYGERVQESVWTCELNTFQYSELRKKLITSRIFRTFFWGSPGQVLLCLKSGHHGRLSRTHGPDVYFCFW